MAQNQRNRKETWRKLQTYQINQQKKGRKITDIAKWIIVKKKALTEWIKEKSYWKKYRRNKKETRLKILTNEAVSGNDREAKKEN